MLKPSKRRAQSIGHMGTRRGIAEDNVSCSSDEYIPFSGTRVTKRATGIALQTNNESIMPRVNAVYVNSEIRNNRPSCYDYARRTDSDSESYSKHSMSSGSYFQDDDDDNSSYSSDDYSVSSEDYSDGSTDEDYSDDDYTADNDYSSGDY